MEQIQNLDDDDHDEKSTSVSTIDHRSTIDTSRPFRSVKKAVAILGERFSAAHIYSPNPFTLPNKETPIFSPSPKLDKTPSWKHHHSSPTPRNSSCSAHDTTLLDTVKKLAAELDQTKAEIKSLKERESETEAALASLNAELHKNMSRLARPEGAGATAPSSSGWHGNMRSSPLPSLAQVLSVGENESLFFARNNKEKSRMKKKPIIPIVGNLFFKKKGSSSTSLDNTLYASSPLHWN